MERRSSTKRREKRQRSRSASNSRDRSRSRDRYCDRRSDRKSKYSSNRNKRDYDYNDYDRHSRSKYQSNHRNQSFKKSIIKSEDNKKVSFKDNKKSVKFDQEAMKKENDKEEEKKEKKKEDFNASGALKRDLETTKNGVVLKYNEPPEGTLCKNRKWRLYEYKGDEQTNVWHIHRKSFFLIGRDERVKLFHYYHPCTIYYSTSIINFRFQRYIVGIHQYHHNMQLFNIEE